jgi:hypothetical protein
MGRAVKWLFVCFAVLVTFGASLWAAMAFPTPITPKQEADQWVAAAAFAGVTAAAALSCGTWWAAREKRQKHADNPGGGFRPAVVSSPGTLVVGHGSRVRARNITTHVTAMPPQATEDEADRPKA